MNEIFNDLANNIIPDNFTRLSPNRFFDNTSKSVFYVVQTDQYGPHSTEISVIKNNKAGFRFTRNHDTLEWIEDGVYLPAENNDSYPELYVKTPEGKYIGPFPFLPKI